MSDLAAVAVVWLLITAVLVVLFGLAWRDWREASVVIPLCMGVAFALAVLIGLLLAWLTGESDLYLRGLTGGPS